MNDPVGCEVCQGLTRNGYTLERFGSGYRCQSHLPRAVQSTPTPPASTPVKTA